MANPNFEKFLAKKKGKGNEKGKKSASDEVRSNKLKELANGSKK